MATAPITAKIERKVSHREWDEATLPATEFFDNLPHIISGAVRLGLIDARDEISDLIDYPTFTFERGTVVADEMWGVSGLRVWTSSFTSGLAEWNHESGSYQKYFHGSSRELGALIKVSFTVDDRLRPLFATPSLNRGTMMAQTEQTAAHTPGPWDCTGCMFPDDDMGGVYYRVQAEGMDACAANARLIAAAPELLRAAMAALNYIANTESELGITLDSGDELRAAIAKARGEQP